MVTIMNDSQYHNLWDCNTDHRFYFLQKYEQNVCIFTPMKTTNN